MLDHWVHGVTFNLKSNQARTRKLQELRNKYCLPDFLRQEIGTGKSPDEVGGPQNITYAT
ncbi:MAG: hypothetical protein R2778_10615 [Saprospiraceae bacterium]